MKENSYMCGCFMNLPYLFENKQCSISRWQI